MNAKSAFIATIEILPDFRRVEAVMIPHLRAPVGAARRSKFG